MTHIKRAKKALAKEKEEVKIRIAALDAVVAGGAACGERFRPQRKCTRCQKGVIETAWHRYWDCDANKQMKHEYIQKSEWLKERFEGRWAEFPWLWNRALVPHELAEGLI